MKAFRIIKKSLVDAFKSTFRNFSLSLASISCTAITLILVAIAILATYNVNDITRDIEDVLTIVAFVDADASEETIANLQQEINQLENVDKEQTKYNSKDDIRETLTKNDEDFKQFFEMLDENPVQPSFVIKVKDVYEISNTAKMIKKMDHITNVRYGESLVNKLVSVFDIVRNGCFIAVIALIVVTAFLIANTIKITIFSRRQEISIMRLVGTSNIVIKLPFLVEGFILGVLGSIIPILITIFGYTFLYDYVGGRLFSDLFLLVEPGRIIYTTSMIILVIGGVVGMIGSLRAVRRFLKV